MAKRKVLWTGLAVLVIGALAAAYLLAARVPRPTLTLPPGQSLTEVRGNCEQGGELLGCTTKHGPRSFLTIRAKGDARAAASALFASLVGHGWTEDVDGLTAQDFGGSGASEDISPLYCKDGCVGLFRLAAGSYELAWFDS